MRKSDWHSTLNIKAKLYVQRQKVTMTAEEDKLY